MSRQQSKRYRHRGRPKPFNVQRALREIARNPVNQDELGTSAIRRFLAPNDSPAYAAIVASANELWDGPIEFAQPGDAGITLMRKSEIDRVRGSQKDFSIGRLGSVSYDLSRHIIKEMLPPSADDPTTLTIGRFIVSKRKGKFHFLLAGLSDAGTVPAERQLLEDDIDAYEGVTHEWPVYRPHVTLGKIAAQDFAPSILVAAKKLSAQYAGETFQALPAE